VRSATTASGGHLELADRYRRQGADELVFYDITASPEGRSVDRSWIGRVARVLDIPFWLPAASAASKTPEAVLNSGAGRRFRQLPRLSDPA